MNNVTYSVIFRAAGRAAIRCLVLAVTLAIQVTVAQAQQWTTSGNNIYNSNSGNVGIGTTSPSVKLEVNGDAIVNGTASFYGDSSFVGGIWSSGSSAAFAAVDRVTSGTGVFYRQSGISRFWDSTAGDVLTFNTSGNVGIGTASPSSKLHIVGDVTVTGNISAKYQDIAEWVPASRSISPGSVVILDANIENSVVSSKGAYDTRVAGVVSAEPGIVLGEQGDNKVKVATTGRVKVRVDATQHPVRIGDLLVTSAKDGMAMKSEPVNFGGIEMHRPGTLIGKALEPLTDGEGEILVLLSLQ